MGAGNEGGLIKAGETRNRLLEADENLSCWRCIRALANMVKDFVVYSWLVYGLQGPSRAPVQPRCGSELAVCD